MRSNIFSMKALRLALLSMFVTSTIIGVNSCRDEFDEREALELEHAFLLARQSQLDAANQTRFLDSVTAAQAAATAIAAAERETLELEAELQARRDELFLIGGSINYAVNVVDGNSTTFSGGNSNGRTSTEDMANFDVTVFHQETGELFTGQTGAAGIVSFPDLRVGKVTVNVIKDGFTPVNFVADITPSSPFERPTAVPNSVGNSGGNSPVGDPNGYVRSAGTVIPVFEIELGNVFDGTQSVPTAELNRYSTVTGKANIETDLTNFVREAAPEGTLVSLSIDADDNEFRQIINRATNNTFGSTEGGNGTSAGNQPGEGNNFGDLAEGDGRIIQLTYSDATFTGVVNGTGDYTIIVPAFPTGRGLPFRVNYSTVAADQTLYDIVGTEANEGATAGGNNAVYDVVTKRAIFDPEYMAPAPGSGPTLPPGVSAGDPSTNIPVFDAIDVSIDPPYAANTEGTGATAKAYINDADGGISQVVISNGGHGYYAAPYVWIKHPDDNLQNAGEGAIVDIIGSFDASNTLYNDDRARATATVEDGVVTAVTVDYPGEGYYAEDGDGNPEPIEVIFIPRGIEPTFSASIEVGGGCIASGTTFSVNAAFTQAPRIDDVQIDDVPYGAYTSLSSGSFRNAFIAALSTSAANGVGTVTLTTDDGSDFCGFPPSARVRIVVGSTVSSMLKLRPTVSIEGGAIGNLTIAEGQYNDNGTVAGVTDDSAPGADTEENVLNGLYTQAPEIIIRGTGTSSTGADNATAVANLNDIGQVESVVVTDRGQDYDVPNTSVTVRSSVDRAASYAAKFVPVSGGTTTGSTFTSVNQGTFYTQEQFDDFNADNSSNDLVTLTAWYEIADDMDDNNPLTTDPTSSDNGSWVAIDALTQSNTALRATPAGTPLNVLYSTAEGDDVTDNPADPDVATGAQVLTADVDVDEDANPTPGIRFTNGGQGFSEADDDLMIVASDDNNTRTPAGATPAAGDVNDVAIFDYELGTGYVEAIEAAAAIAIPANQPNLPYGIVLADENGNVPVDADGDVITDGSTVGGISVEEYEQGLVIFPRSTSGDGIASITVDPGFTSPRFTQTPEVEQVTGTPGAGFEYVVNMDFQYAADPVLNDFMTNGTFSFELPLTDGSGNVVEAELQDDEPLRAVLANAILGAGDDLITMRFRDAQGTLAANLQPTQGAQFFATAEINGDNAVLAALETPGVGGAAAISAASGGGEVSITFTIQPNTFTQLNNGGLGYTAVNIEEIDLEVFELAGNGTPSSASVTLITENIVVDDDNGTIDADGQDADGSVEGLSSIALGGAFLSAEAVSGREGSGYSESSQFTVRGLEQSITSDNLELNFTSAGGNLTGDVISSGNDFPLRREMDGTVTPNREFIRLLLPTYTGDVAQRADAGTGTDNIVDPAFLVPLNRITDITLARRIGSITLADVTGAEATNIGLPASGSFLGQLAVSTNAPTTPRENDNGVVVNAQGKTFAWADVNGNGESDAGDAWVRVGSGYSEDVTVSVTSRSFIGGAADDDVALEVRSSGLAVGSVQIVEAVVHPTVGFRNPDATMPNTSVYEEPYFVYTFGAPEGSGTFGIPTTAGTLFDANGAGSGFVPVRGLLDANVAYNYRNVNTSSRPFTLAEVEILEGGEGYEAAPFFRVVPQKTAAGMPITKVGDSASGTATIAGGAVSGVDVTAGGSFTVTTEATRLDELPDIVLSDFLRVLRLREEGIGNVKIDGIGIVNNVLFDNAGEGYEAGTTPTLTVIPKGNDFEDANGDGIYQPGEFSGDQEATITINAGADLENLTSADFAISPNSGYTQDPDIVVNTHLRNYIAIPRVDDNPVFVTTTPNSSNTLRAFVVENLTETDFDELPFDLSDTNGDGIIDETAAWNGQPNEGLQPIELADLNNIPVANTGRATASARTNEGVISRINIGSRGDGLVAGTYPLIFFGGGPNAGGAAGTVTVDEDGEVESVSLTDGGASYDDNFVNPGADGVLNPAGYGADGVPGTNDAGETSDDFVGVRVLFPMGAGAEAEAISTPFTVDKIEVVSAGQGYDDEPISVRVVPAARDRAPGTTVEDFLQDPTDAAPGVVETTVANVTFDDNGGLATITIDNPGAGYSTNPIVVIENFRTLLEREAAEAFADSNGDQQFGTFDFEDYVTAKVAVEVNAEGEISDVSIINPGFGYIANPTIRVIGIGSGADLEATGIDFVAGSTGEQTGVGDYFGNYFLGGTALPGINFADHRLGGVNIIDGGSGYFGGNFPRTFQAFQAGWDNMTNVYIPAGVNYVNDIYYGTGQRNLSEDSDTGSGPSNGRTAAGDDQ